MNVIPFSEQPPKVFGHLYIVVFSNGTVKAGMTCRDLGSRVNSHKNSGKAFGISMDSVFTAKIYTDDTKDREKVMHKELSLVSTLTAGREWFKFDNPSSAGAFACAYLEKAERMSLIERPTEQQIAAAATCKLAAFDAIFGSMQAEAIRQDTLQRIAVVLDSIPPRNLVHLAYQIMAYEESLTAESNPAPELKCVIDRHYEESFASGRPGCSFDAIESREVVLTAAQYPIFFKDALAWC